MLFLKPVFQERILGGTALRNEFNYNIPSNLTGECWAISAHPNGPNEIENGKYKGQTLDKVWQKDKRLFGEPDEEKFPLLTKILDANDKLSVQVHPDDNYALANEGEYGKTECWYILDAKKDAEIIYGINATNKEDMNKMIDHKEFSSLFKTVKVKPGDFYYVPAGTVHAIGAGIMILETQQSSDTTYRIYDYNRKDKNGNTRDLHLKQSKEVINISNESPNIIPKTEKCQNQIYTQFVSNEFFTVEKWDINGEIKYHKEYPYCLVSVIEGKGIIEINSNKKEIEKGQHFILTTEDKEINFNGKLKIIVSHP